MSAQQDARPAVHINWTRYSLFMVVVRPRGHRNWTRVAAHKTEARARAELARLVRRGGPWRYARLIACQEWYEPNTLIEVRQ